MAEVPDYYAVLGVGRDASPEEIKRAYRERARRCHPDVVQDDPDAEEQFKQLTQAYRVLSDPQLRSRYDHTGRVDGPVMASPDEAFMDFFDLVDSMFGFGPRAGTRASRRGRARGRDLQVTVTVSLEEVLEGTLRQVSYRRLGLCRTCRGSGCAPGTSPQPCATCRGSGYVQRVTNTFFAQVATTAPCHHCAGKGYVIPRPCQDCRGQGVQQEDQVLEVDLPPGVEDGAGRIVQGQGDYPPGGGVPGDLHVVVALQPHPRFERHGADICAALPLNPAQAALGADLTVDGLDGSIDIKVRPGVQHGDEVTVRGRGLPRKGRGRGNARFFVRIAVSQPKTRRERELLEELDRLWADRQ